jgi:hypothetical protein
VFPADGFDAAWTTWDGGPGETLALRWENEAWTASIHSGRHAVDYVYRLSPMWQIRQLLLFRDLDEPDLWLGTDGHGRWGEVNGAHRVDLDGTEDIAVSGSAFAHVVPIRRVNVAAGEAVDVSMAEVDVETLGVVPRQFRYHRVDARCWQVTTPSADVEFEVDDFGLPLDLPGDLRRSA